MRKAQSQEPYLLLVWLPLAFLNMAAIISARRPPVVRRGLRPRPPPRPRPRPRPPPPSHLQQEEQQQ